MTDGSWRLGVFIDDKASDEQAEKLLGVFSGQVGGPMEGLAPLIGENLGGERGPIDVREQAPKPPTRTTIHRGMLSIVLGAKRRGKRVLPNAHHAQRLRAFPNQTPLVLSKGSQYVGGSGRESCDSETKKKLPTCPSR
jgi:Protein of unknown function (DUF1326)